MNQRIILSVIILSCLFIQIPIMRGSFVTKMCDERASYVTFVTNQGRSSYLLLFIKFCLYIYISFVFALNCKPPLAPVCREAKGKIALLSKARANKLITSA